MASSLSRIRLLSWRKLRQCTWRELRLLAEATMWLALFAVAIRLVAFKRLAAWLDLTQNPPGGVQEASAAQDEAVAIGWAVRIAAVLAPWRNTCLAQALAGAQMLRCRRMTGMLTLGVAITSGKDERMDAHAWLQQGGVFLTGEAGHQQFTPVSTFVCKPRQ